MTEDKKPKIGLWVSTDKNGNKFMKGSDEKFSYKIFKNTYKTPGSKQPDYNLMIDERIANGEATTTQSRSDFERSEERAKQFDAFVSNKSQSEDDVPF